MGMGYTGRDWCTLSTRSLGDPVRNVFSDGLTFGTSELGLLNAIEGLQHCLKGKLVPNLLKHVAGVDAKALTNLLHRDPRSLSATELNQTSGSLNIALRRSASVESLLGPLGMTTIDPYDDHVVITQCDRVLFKIPQPLYRKVHSYNQVITGET